MYKELLVAFAIAASIYCLAFGWKSCMDSRLAAHEEYVLVKGD